VFVCTYIVYIYNSEQHKGDVSPESFTKTSGLAPALLLSLKQRYLQLE